MIIKDYVVICLLLSFLLWAIFHQLASRYINKSEELKKILYGDNRELSLSDIESALLAIIFIHTVYFFSKENFSNFFNKKSTLFYQNLSSDSVLSMIKDHKKLWSFIKISSFFGLMIFFNTVLFFYI